MEENYQVTKTSRATAEANDKVIFTTTTTRLILRPEIILINRQNPDAKLKICLIHQRKTPSGSWEDDAGDPLNILKAGQQIKLALDSATTLNLYREMKIFYELASDVGHSYAGTNYVLSREEDIIQIDSKRTQLIKSILAKGHSGELWHELIESDPDLATRLSYARIQEQRKNALEEFSINLGSQMNESAWQKFFERNTWIFGYGLKYHFLNLVSDQPHYGGGSLTGKGMQIGDFLTHTAADIKFTVLIEIKKPDSPLLGKNSYRNGAWQLGEELVGGVSQLQANCYSWETEGSMSRANREKLQEDKIYTMSPKGILIIGKTDQLKGNQDGRNTFERFRRSLSNPEVITFDELYERAKYIVGSHLEVKNDADATPCTLPTDADDIPF